MFYANVCGKESAHTCYGIIDIFGFQIIPH